MSGSFERIFPIVVGNEGGFSNDPADPGNWTGGRVGAGACRGTNWGISAAAFPSIDIARLTLQDAKALYLGAYWTPLCLDEMEAGVALLVFDAAVNNGPRAAAQLLQEAVSAAADGWIGPETLAKVSEFVAGRGAEALCSEFQARRLLLMAALSDWRVFGGGWARRLCSLPFDAAALLRQPQG